MTSPHHETTYQNGVEKEKAHHDGALGRIWRFCNDAAYPQPIGLAYDFKQIVW
jgi:hypothetical protein